MAKAKDKATATKAVRQSAVFVWWVTLFILACTLLGELVALLITRWETIQQQRWMREVRKLKDLYRL